ncbi:HHR235Wp [Eremothecium sinecaudum]|uniref:Pantoate--beta-alanine ligase n=1 Tax=Eremothecium sinecaudum TaxID=45286 RepID=A0A0X8HX04_9SACH|nr:HHR235Wp [Eremothecium sinecaudum]AMD23004.1 HHR235Wp [Eremothecium sinecaudum]
MKIFNCIPDIVQWRLTQVSRPVETIGFVPTMGCLHAGHIALVNQSRKENSLTVVSIFVNPSQFAPGEDLDKYPKTLEADLDRLRDAGVDAVFVPTPAMLYPQGIPLDVTQQRGPFVSVHGISEVLEGRTRPNFFRGVATVVTKLFNIVSPDKAYFGQKDIQQFLVLETMVRELFMPVKLVMMPIVRDDSGLALSSRNRYLCPESAQLASAIYRGLQSAASVIQNAADQVSRSEVEAAAYNHWNPLINSGDFKVDYLSIAEKSTLQELGPSITKSKQIVLSCAVYVTDRENKATVVRLIDNILIEN